MTTCRRCKKPIEIDEAELCWYCHGSLCADCWESVGHCGHPEAEAENVKVKVFYAKSAW